MSYRIAGIDVHKKMIAVVIADIAERNELVWARRQFPATPDQLRAFAQWLVDEQVQEAVMESTAQYWKPVWGTRLSPRLGYKQAIWAVAHRLCRLLWIILHRGDRYEERGPAVSMESKRRRVWRMVRDLRKLGYRVDGPLSAIPA